MNKDIKETDMRVSPPLIVFSTDARYTIRHTGVPAIKPALTRKERRIEKRNQLKLKK